MSDFALPVAQHDELDVGLVGRIAAINGCSDRSRVLAGLRSALDLPSPTRLLPALAACVGLTPREFAFHHTLLPVLRAFSSHVGTAREAEILNRHVSLMNFRSLPNVEARACRACSAEDGAAGIAGYWRRIHHLPGVDWCPRHGTPLHRFRPTAFSVRPVDAIGRVEAIHDEQVQGVAPDDVLKRYTEFLMGWLRRDSALSSAALKAVVREGCRRHGLRCTQMGRRPTISDMAKEQLPGTWLKQHWPEVFAKASAGAFLYRIDGTSKDRHVAYPGATCALALAILFDSVDEANALLETENAKVLSAQYGGTSMSQDRLQAAGVAFIRGDTFSGVCKAHGIPVARLEAWLREQAKQCGNLPSNQMTAA